ncbi:serine-rich adhesin for platelets-like isoform X2 [Periplaneta americana]|uniref:serine-rich adhesin for platelets-like isoform X2 n=1 Tax=Periplaneta americana TaxID=6978 RepID=UPI0037E77DCE
MESFLPSEVARLVYGYLESAKCNDAARNFLEKSPHLSECLAVFKEGRGFNTKPGGYSLQDILDEYCEIRSLVSERIQRLPENSAEKLRQSGSLIGQLRYLIDATRSGQTLLGASPQGSNSCVTSILSGRTKSRIHSTSDRGKRNVVRTAQESKQQHTKDSDDKQPSTSSSMLLVEATPLESLPGMSGTLDTQSTQTVQENGNSEDCEREKRSSNDDQTAESDLCEHPDAPCENASKVCPCSSSQCKKCSDRDRTSKYQNTSYSRTNSSSTVDVHNSSLCEDGPIFTSSPKRKSLNSSKRKCANPTPVKGVTPVKNLSPSKVRRSHSDDNDSSESLDFSVLTRALLDNKELHEKIAENINRVIRNTGPGEGLENVENNASTTAAVEPSSTEVSPIIAGSSAPASASDMMLHELNHAIKTIVDETQQDPVFERFLEEIIGPLDDEMTPSPAENQSEGDDAVPDLAPPPKQTKGSLHTHHKKVVASQHPHEEQNLESSDVPLKQRLRSARQRKVDVPSSSSSVSPTTGTSKDKKKESTSLEDQNAAAVECIVNAKLTSRNDREASCNQQLQTSNSSSNTRNSQTFNSSRTSDNSQDRLDSTSREKHKDNSAVVSSSQKDLALTVDVHDANTIVQSTNAIKATDISKHGQGEVILFEGNLTFMDSNTSLPLSTDTGSNFIFSSPSLKSQLSTPLVMATQPSAMSTAVSQVMTITIPSATDSVCQAGSLSSIPIHSSLQQSASHGVSGTSAGQVVTFAIPGSLNTVTSTPSVHQGLSEQDVMSMSTVIMCGNDGMMPQFISLPQQDCSRSGLLLPTSGNRFVPIVPRMVETPVTTTVTTHLTGSTNPRHLERCQPGLPNIDDSIPKGKLRQTKSSMKCNKLSSASGKMNVKDKTEIQTRSQKRGRVLNSSTVMGITLYADDSNDIEVSCPNTEQQYPTGSGHSLPSIIVESPQTKMSSISAQENGVTSTQETGREKLLGALDLKETPDNYPSRTVNKSKSSDDIDRDCHNKDERDQSKSKSTTSMSLQNIDKLPPSPNLTNLVNLSKNNILVSSGHTSTSGVNSPAVISKPSNVSKQKSRDTPKPGISCATVSEKRSNNASKQKSRDTPQPSTSQGRKAVNSKRLSLSTPRKQRHVRALDFTTPPKTNSFRQSHTSPKHQRSKKQSPKTSEKVTETIRKIRSTLFKSPDNTDTSASHKPLSTSVTGLSSADTENNRNKVPPIATRSPPPQLCGDWDKATGIGQMINEDEEDVDAVDDETGFDEPATETEADVIAEEANKMSNITENKDDEHISASNTIEEDSKNKLSLPKTKKTWDADLRALLNADYDGNLLPPEDDNHQSEEKVTKKKVITTTKPRRRFSKVTEEEARRIEECLITDIGASEEDHSSAKTKKSEEIPSSSDLEVEKSVEDPKEASGISDLKEVIKTTTKPRRRASQITKEEARRIEECLITDISVNNEVQCRAETRKSERIPSSSDILVDKSVDNTQEVNEDSDMKERIHADSDVPAKGKSALHERNMETLNESECVHPDSEEKSSGNPNEGKLKRRSVLNEMDNDVHVDLLEETCKSEIVIDSAENHVTNTEPNKFLIPETSNINEIDLSESSDADSIGPASPCASVGSPLSLASSSKVIQSPTKLKAAKRTIVQDNLHVSQTNSQLDIEETVETFVIQTEDSDSKKNNKTTENETMQINTEDKYLSDSRNILSMQRNNVQDTSTLESKDLMSSVSGNAEPSATVSGNSTVKISKTQKQVNGTSEIPDAEPRSVATAALDTPNKIDDPGGIEFSVPPLTPRVLSPQPHDTPYTKQAISSTVISCSFIQTPNFPPPTPCISVTPQSCQSSEGTPSFVTRPTDYSSCSSYYKPSNEQDLNTSDKPLMQVLIEECNKLESDGFRNFSTGDADNKNCTSKASPVLDKTSRDEEKGNTLDTVSCSLSSSDRRKQEKENINKGSGKGQTKRSGAMSAGSADRKGRFVSRKSLNSNDLNVESDSEVKIGNKIQSKRSSRRRVSSLNRSQNEFESQTDSKNENNRNSKQPTSSASVLTEKQTKHSGIDSDDSEDEMEIQTNSEVENEDSSLLVSFKRKNSLSESEISKSRRETQMSLENKNESNSKPTISIQEKTGKSKRLMKGMAPSNGVNFRDKINKKTNSDLVSSEQETTKGKTRSQLRSNKSDDYGDIPSAQISLGYENKSKSKRKKIQLNTNIKGESDNRAQVQTSPHKGKTKQKQGSNKILKKKQKHKTKNKVIKRFVEDAWRKLFPNDSPSDDPDFESSNEYLPKELSEIEAENTSETKGSKSAANEKRKSSDAVSSKEHTEEVARTSSRGSQMWSKSPKSPRTWEEDIREKFLPNDEDMDKEDSISQQNQNKDSLMVGLSPFKYDTAGTRSRASHFSNTAAIISELEDKKRRMLAKLKDTDISSSTDSNIKHTEKKIDSITFAACAAPHGLQSETTLEVNPTHTIHSRDDIYQVENTMDGNPVNSGIKRVENVVLGSQDKSEVNPVKISAVTPNKGDNEPIQAFAIKQGSMDTTPAKEGSQVTMKENTPFKTTPRKSSHLSVEAIAEKLTRQKIAIQAHPVVTQSPSCQPVTCEDSSSEDFPALHLSSDDEGTQPEQLNFSQIERQVAKLHGGEETKLCDIAVPTPVPVMDIRRDLEATPNRVQDIQTNLSTTSATNIEDDHKGQYNTVKESDTEKCNENPSVDVTVTPLTAGSKTNRKKLSPAEREANANKRIRDLLGEDVSPIKNFSEVKKTPIDLTESILWKLLVKEKKDKSPNENRVKVTKLKGPVKRNEKKKPAKRKKKKKSPSKVTTKLKETDIEHNVQEQVGKSSPSKVTINLKETDVERNVQEQVGKSSPSKVTINLKETDVERNVQEQVGKSSPSKVTINLKETDVERNVQEQVGKSSPSKVTINLKETDVERNVQEQIGNSSPPMEDTSASKVTTKLKETDVEHNVQEQVGKSSPPVEDTLREQTNSEYKRIIVSENETCIEIRYADDGPKGNNFAFGDISTLSYEFELSDNESERGEKAGVCTITDFQELYCYLPDCVTNGAHTSKLEKVICEFPISDIKEGNACDVKSMSTSISHEKDRHVESDKISKGKYREFQSHNKNLEHDSKADGYRIKSLSPDHQRPSTSVNKARGSVNDIHKRRSPCPVHRRWASSPVYRRQSRSRSLDRRRSISPMSSSSKTSISPLQLLYDETMEEKRRTRLVSRVSRRNQEVDWRRNFSPHRSSFRRKDRDRFRDHDDRYRNDRYHGERYRGHVAMRDSSHNSSSLLEVFDSSKSRILHAPEEKGSTSDGGRRRYSDVVAEKRCETQTENILSENDKVEDSMVTEQLEDGEVVDEECSRNRITPDKSADQLQKEPSAADWLQKEPSTVPSDDDLMTYALVGSSRVENSGEDTPPVIKDNLSLPGASSDQTLDCNRLLEEQPVQETGKLQEKSAQKEANLSSSSSGRTLPPKKRKASSEDMGIQAEKRIRPDNIHALQQLKNLDLDHLLNFVHGEKPR